MTTAVATYHPDTNIYEITVKGHATGSNTVCAAVSGIVYALAGYLANDDETKMLVQWLEPGDSSLQFTCGERGLGAVQMACIGLMQIEKSDPQYIKTKISENIFDIGA